MFKKILLFILTMSFVQTVSALSVSPPEDSSGSIQLIPGLSQTIVISNDENIDKSMSLSLSQFGLICSMLVEM